MRATRAITAVIIIFTLSANLHSQAELNNLESYYGFGEMEIIKLDWNIRSLEIADFNGDGRNDIAAANNRRSRIEVLLQKESVGPAEAAVSVDPNDIDINIITTPTRFKKETVPVSQKIYSLVCGDLNSDGTKDLAFYGSPKGLYIMLQKSDENKTAKTLGWRTREKIKIDDGLITSDALVCTDLNNDGRDDLALAGRDVVYIVLQKDNGTLAEAVKYPTTERILYIKTGDLNGDKVNDLVLITSDRDKPAHIRFGLERGQLGPQRQFFIENPYKLELYNVNDLAGDEILSVDKRSGRLICYGFAKPKKDQADWPILLYPLTSSERNTERDLVIGDFDGDGLADVAISEPAAAELLLYKQTTNLGLIEPLRFPAFSDISSLSAADIDDDGKTELAILSVKEKIIGLSKFEDDRLGFPKPIDVTGEPVAMELADLDNDGHIDCTYISRDTNDISYLRVIYNLAATNKIKAKTAKKKLFETKKKVGETEPALKIEGLVSNPDGMKVLDVDQDGLDDILIFVKYEEPILIRQVRKKEFVITDAPDIQASLIKDASLCSIAVANIDGQKGQEMLLAQKNFARSLIFEKAENWSIVDQYNAKSTENKISAVAAFDISDGGPRKRPAILLLDGRKGNLQILNAGEDKTYRFEKELDVGNWNAATHLKMLFAPLTGNDSKSILLFDGEKFALITVTGDNEVLPNLEQQFSYETKIKDGVYGNLTAGDINSDGRIDIIMVEYNHNHIEILAIDSRSEPAPAMRFKIFEEKNYRGGKKRGKTNVEPRELKIADVTGDGKNDLVTITHDRIIIYPQN